MDADGQVPPRVPAKPWLWLEWALIFVVWPALMWTEWFSLNLFVFFAIPFVYTYWVWRRGDLPPAPPPSSPGRPGWGWLIRWAVLAVILTGLTWYYLPDRFLGFPTRAPWGWAMVMVAYPFVSARPQEYMYRRYYFSRYASLMPPRLLLASNVLLFAGLHLMYDQWQSVVLTLVGGAFFASTYLKTGHLREAWIEHALYGNLFFTIGLGGYFYNGVGGR